MKFFDGLDPDLKQSLRAQLRNLWTYASTGIEGNTLTLGETAFVIDEGLTVGGKPLKDHQQVIGHAHALEMLYTWVARTAPFNEQDLFELHRAVYAEAVTDIYHPIGAWKNEPNGTYAVDDADKQVYLEYATPHDTPALMTHWLTMLNRFCAAELATDTALTAYADLHVAFVRIHPFCDGNGRMARLLANLPLLKSGHAPIVIPREWRRDYIRLLARYELAVGVPRTDQPLLPQRELLAAIREFCAQAWKPSLDLIAAAHAQQRMRGA